MKKNKKGQISLYVTFLILAIVIIAITAFIAPLGTRINSEFYVAGEKLIIDSNSTIQQIKDTEVKNSLTSVFGKAVAATEQNITVGTNLFRYSWVMMVGLTAIVIFLLTRQIVEVQNQGGGFI